MRPNGDPHIVPVTFALIDDTVVTMVDHKPKKTTRLQRLVNVESNRRVSMLVDRYNENWAQLWWVRLDGLASIHTDDQVWSDGRDALAAKYAQY